jgi:hypothetical protein
MKLILGSVASVLLLLASPALGGTAPWYDGWYVNGDLAYHAGTTDPPAITGDNVAVFEANDPRLGPTHGNPGYSGGMHWSYDQDGPYRGGDNARALLNVDMNVPAGEYYFEVDMDILVNWNPVSQPWGLGQEWYIGDSADMDYGIWPGDGAPGGPWQGGNWGNNNGTKLGSQWNGADGANPDVYNGNWYHKNFTQEVDGGVNTITTTGTVIFRSLGRWKVRNDPGEFMSIAMDNLRITLTPVAGGTTCCYEDKF